ncbi:class A beta-lactamase-related serine hydrolase [bacterium]|nr:MAG: class A beta-lactamase-related serine hydrolase [bacterium]
MPPLGLLVLAAQAFTLTPREVMRAAESRDFVGVAAYSNGGHSEYLSAGRMRADARFPICSVTKLFTAVLVLQEIERGRLALETKAKTILPELSKELDETTILDLLTHASTLANMDDAGPKDADGIAEAYRDRTPRDYSATPIARRLARRGSGVAGAAFVYNNLDFVVLAALMERLEGSSYAKLVQRKIIAPLRLRSTSVLVKPLLPRELPRSTSEPLNFAVYSGAGAIVSTTGDLLRFGEAILRGKILSPRGRAMLLTNAPRFGYIGFASFRTTIAFGGKILPVIDRPGAIGDFSVRFELVPGVDTVVVVATPKGDFDLGRVYEARGLSYDLLAAALSSSSAK